MDVYEAITKRRSIRRYQDKLVPYDVLEKCVDAARLAPSARNRQLCEYIIVDDEKLRTMVARSIIGWGGYPLNEESPLWVSPPKAYIIILINSALEAADSASRRVTTYDVGMSAENIILVALKHGLGTCPILAFKKSVVKKIFNITEGYDIALIVAMGYPDESPVTEVSTGPVERWVDSQGAFHLPKRKLEDITHHNKFP